MIIGAVLFMMVIPFVAFVAFVAFVVTRPSNEDDKYEQQKRKCKEQMENYGANEGAQAMLSYVLGNGKSSKEFWNDYEEIYKRECEGSLNSHKDESEDE